MKVREFIEVATWTWKYRKASFFFGLSLVVSAILLATAIVLSVIA